MEQQRETFRRQPQLAQVSRRFHFFYCRKPTLI